MFNRKCDVCAEKDARIKDLQDQVTLLSKLLVPQKPTQDITIADLEVDSLLNGQEEAIKLDDAVAREADRFLGGDYDYPEESN